MTLRVYNPETLEIMHIFDTSFIREWHTITYSAIEAHGNRVCCVTQNGFLFIMDLCKMDYVFYGRIHNGSTEGLDWKSNLISTCSSECIISLIRV